ncbi:cell wall hydrolase [Sphingomonas bacterium]|uniref:cell wall hydrolase n=1 Tax=Sphingomonas bacterium TaxID=1895847 RepID=UPI0015766CB6|nr:cell wall hydrolase [Sphingomonas bacterium]
MQRRVFGAWLILVGLSLTALLALSAHAAFRAVAAHGSTPAAIVAISSSGYEVDDHFPGAALLYADAPAVPATPAASHGTTGTTALPPLPIPNAAAEAIALRTVGVVSALPFTMAHVAAIDRGRAIQCLTAAIYYEAASEPDAGQQAVAQTILNRVRHPAFPATVCGVVYQGSEHSGCQFSFACDGSMARIPSRAAWDRAQRVAVLALAGRVYAPVGLATHYHTYSVTPVWNRALVMTDAVGAHFFHRWKGYWGTPAAFHQHYAGGEPIPGPHPHAIPDAPLALALALALALPTAPVAAAVEIRPAYRDSGKPIALVAHMTADNLPPASTVLDRWKDSGKPLR